MTAHQLLDALRHARHAEKDRAAHEAGQSVGWYWSEPTITTDAAIAVITDCAATYDAARIAEGRPWWSGWAKADAARIAAAALRRATFSGATAHTVYSAAVRALEIGPEDLREQVASRH